MSLVCKLSDAESVTNFGGKAANLAKMLQSGLPVPKGLAVGLDAFNEKGDLTELAQSAIEQHLDPSKLYAVRSSALAEDAKDASWAGQFESFLNTKPEDVVARVVECHNSTKARAKAYAGKQGGLASFDVAVVIQEMVQPEYAGVLFTKDPVSGQSHLVAEYVEGLGEDLVSGKADPKQITWKPGDKIDVPFDLDQLTELAEKVEKKFGAPQDIEWAWADNTMWLVQTRPITAIQQERDGYYLGEPEDLFYWGPSRAQPLYMSDFMAAAERFFTFAATEPSMPNPPKTLVLFHDGKMVWLNNAQAFVDFAEKTFVAYEAQTRIEKDIATWENFAHDPREETLVEAWYATEFAEFALYGAEAALAKRLARFDTKTRQELWGAFTVPDKPTFLSRIDNELAESKDVAGLAKQYPWIEDDYDGLSDSAKVYFEKRLSVVSDARAEKQDNASKRTQLAAEHKLTAQELNTLDLARKLAEFMDDRKAWMMQTRRLLTKQFGKITDGWFFNEGKVVLVSKEETAELWSRYVDFKASNNAVSGVVASNGGKHFVSGEVAVVSSPTDIVKDDQIVVVPSTSPSYVPLMRKARALVTDHGGMMSHAAIVAREFNLPCIVGTKQATKVLSNGDKVVLDLVKGEVSK